MSEQSQSQALENEVRRYSKLNGYEITKYLTQACDCGHTKFRLYSDDDECCAKIKCSSCYKGYYIESSETYMKTKRQNVCTCHNECLNIGIGYAMYDNSDDVRWVYVGANCDKCGLSGVYVDWNER